MLYIRMFLYALFGIVAGQGLAVYDAEAGTLTFHVEHLATLATGALGFVTTFITSRFAKHR